MTNKQQKKLLCVDDLRHAEYYQMQDTFDNLYSKSRNGEIFQNLMPLILSRENILLAYRNIKSNGGSKTRGTDKVVIDGIGRLSAEEYVEKLRYIVAGSKHGYRPKAVRRKEIPKPNGKLRPLGIPCMWDRLVQQCIKQILEPICEAKFSENSYGFRPLRSVEHAIQRIYQLMQRANLHYVVEFDIKGFFDNVDHSKLIKQIWSLGIRDKHLLYVIKQILKAPIKMPDGEIQHPKKGTPQGGIISPLLANIVLNELDHWIDSQWIEHPITEKYSYKVNSNGSKDLGHAYRAMKTTGLKEMYIVRYADDFRILCRTKSEAERIRIAVSKWLWERLRLEVSPEKTRIVNVKKKYSEFLGFKIKVHPKGRKWTVESHVCDKALCRQKEALIEQAKKVAKPPQHSTESYEIHLYNAKVVGAQSYYKIATHINLDFNGLNLAVMRVFTNRLRTQKCNRLRRKGRPLTKAEIGLYGNTPMMRYVAGSDEPIYPIGFVQHKPPWTKKRKANLYTAEGRKEIHDNLRINTSLMVQMMKSSGKNSTEYSDNRISLYSAQWGKCGITGIEFQCLEDIHCHHKMPKQYGGTDRYDNLVLLLPQVHRLIHAADEITIRKYLELLKLDKTQILKLNKYRELAKNNPITVK
ncbi:MAG: group II intron reverse transcriptase/maturase [Clostridiales bacterium]|nr:group II intron reverse transcriptase/maturase [Clostridiales bacterium]